MTGSMEAAIVILDEKEGEEKLKTNSEIKNIIEFWWRDHIHDSPASRNTEIFNYLQQVKINLLEAFN